MADNPSPEVTVAEAKRLRFEIPLDSFRVARLRSFRTRISEWITPSTTVTEEEIFIRLRKDRREMRFTIPHSEVVDFLDLLEHKKAQGYKVTVRDAVLAFLLMGPYGRAGSKTLITAFLRQFPEFADVSEKTVGEALSFLRGKHPDWFVPVWRREEIWSWVEGALRKRVEYISSFLGEEAYALRGDIIEDLKRKIRWWSFEID